MRTRLEVKETSLGKLNKTTIQTCGIGASHKRGSVMSNCRVFQYVVEKAILKSAMNRILSQAGGAILNAQRTMGKVEIPNDDGA